MRSKIILDQLKFIFLELPNATNVPFWKRSSCILGRSGLFGKGYESVLDILEAFDEKVGSVLYSTSLCGRTQYCGLQTPATREAFGKRTERKLAIREPFGVFGKVSESVRKVLEKNTV